MAIFLLGSFISLLLVYLWFEGTVLSFFQFLVLFFLSLLDFYANVRHDESMYLCLLLSLYSCQALVLSTMLITFYCCLGTFWLAVAASFVWLFWTYACKLGFPTDHLSHCKVKYLTLISLRLITLTLDILHCILARLLIILRLFFNVHFSLFIILK